jgi:5'-nucleotidase
MKRKPLILITNDDGISSPGLEAAGEAVEDLGEVWVVAPREENSSCSHAMTLTVPILCRKLRPRWFALDGTPADCVFVAVSDILPSMPDLVVAGVNDGFNLGKDTFYSGTVAAAREAAFRGIPGAAVSIRKGEDPRSAVKIVRMAARSLLGISGGRRSPGMLLNINIPSGDPGGILVTKLGRRVYHDLVIKRRSPRKHIYYWIDGGPVAIDPGRGTDGSAVSSGFVSVTPLGLDQTDRALLGKRAGRSLDREIRKWSRQLED